MYRHDATHIGYTIQIIGPRSPCVNSIRAVLGGNGSLLRVIELGTNANILSSKPMNWLEILEHTGEIGILATGQTVGQAFSEVTRGICSRAW